jgi:hypothetical protein
LVFEPWAVLEDTPNAVEEKPTLPLPDPTEDEEEEAPARGHLLLIACVTLRTFDTSDCSADACITRSAVIAAWAMSLRVRVTRTLGPLSPVNSVAMSAVRTSAALW